MYIDLFVIQTLFYDYLILSSVAVLLRVKLKYHRLLGGMLLSVGLSMAAYLYFPWALLFIPLLTIRVVFGNQGRTRYFRSCLYAYTGFMILSGAAMTIGAFFTFQMPVLAYVFTALSLSFLVTLVYVVKTDWEGQQETLSQFTHEVRLYCGASQITGWGFVDTGNHLIDHKTASPVMMVPRDKLPSGSLELFLSKNRIPFWETAYSVINDSSQSLRVFKPTLLMINGTVVQDVVVGVVENDFPEYDFLLQPSIVKYI